MHTASENAVTRWFGPQFSALHPLLQELHRHGGSLQGQVDIAFGPGIAGLIGRRLARKLGIPVDKPRCGFRVDIRHEGDALYWQRHFEGGNEMLSVFRPQGHWPGGFWQEQTGPLCLYLGVDVVEGGWYWRLRQVRLGAVALPPWLLPASRAGKYIENGRYHFEVDFSLPLLGRLLRYSGSLSPVPA